MSVAPEGTPDTRVNSDQVSELSLSGVSKVGLIVIQLSSLPAAEPVTVPASSTGSRFTVNVVALRALGTPASLSVATAVSVSSNRPDPCGGGVSTNSVSCADVSSQLPSAV